MKPLNFVPVRLQRRRRLRWRLLRQLSCLAAAVALLSAGVDRLLQRDLQFLHEQRAAHARLSATAEGAMAERQRMNGLRDELRKQLAELQREREQALGPLDALDDILGGVPAGIQLKRLQQQPDHWNLEGVSSNGARLAALADAITREVGAGWSIHRLEVRGEAADTRALTFALAIQPPVALGMSGVRP